MRAIKDFFEKIGPFNFIIISLVIGFTAQYYMYIKKNINYGLIYFGAALIFFIIADLVSKNKKTIFSSFLNGGWKADDNGMSRQEEIVWFIAIIAVAVFFRFYKIADMPIGMHRDEGKVIIDSYNIMTGKQPLGADSALPVYIRAISDNPAMYNYIIIVFLKFLGPGLIEARIASAIIGTMAVISFYFFIRYLFGARTAVITGMLFACYKWPVHFSRIIYHSGFSVFFIILVLYFLYRVIGSRKYYDFAFFGLALALVLNTYHASRAIPGAILLVIIFLLIVKLKFFSENWKKIVLSLLVFTIAIMPLGLYLGKHWKSFMNRPSGLFILSETNVKNKINKSRFELYTDSVKRSFLMFNLWGDKHVTYNANKRPMAGFYMGALGVLGFGYLLYRLFFLSGFSFVSMILFITFLHGTILFIGSPHSARGVLTLPFPALFAAVFISKANDYLNEQYGKKVKATVYVAVIILISLACVECYNLYFKEFATNKYAWIGNDAAQRKTAEYLVKSGKEWKGIVPPQYKLGDMPTSEWKVVMLKHPEIEYEQFLMGRNFPVPPDAKKNYVYMLLKKYESLIPLMKSMYPHGRLAFIANPYIEGDKSNFIYEVPLEDIKNYKHKGFPTGLRGNYYRGKLIKGKPFISRIDPFILFNWQRADNPGGPGFFSAKWTGKIRIEKPGEYTFYVRTWDFADLIIDGKKIATKDNNSWRTETVMKMTKGLHAIEIDYHSMYANNIEFMWKKPGDVRESTVPSGVLLP